MKKTLLAGAAVAAILSLGAPGLLAQMSVPAKVAGTAKGKSLVDTHGITLYTFDRDNAPGKSELQRQMRGQLAPLCGNGRCRRHG